MRYQSYENGLGISKGSRMLECKYFGELDDVRIRKILYEYLRMDDDYLKIMDNIAVDDYIKDAIERFPGMRLLRQDPWECFISYLCSSISSIPQISRNIEALSKMFGCELVLDGIRTYSFPEAAYLAKADEMDIRKCGVGFRAKNISAAANRIVADGIILDELREWSYQDAKCFLMTFQGVGEKIADCVLAFSLDKLEAFPVDRWIRRAMLEDYEKKMIDYVGKKGRGSKSSSKKYSTRIKDQDIRDFSAEYFKGFAAYAQEFLFYHKRTCPRPE